jgi:phage-related protein
MADKIYWIDANGNEHPLNIDGYRVLEGMKGRFMPPIAVTKDEVPFQHGARKRNIKIKDRPVDIPLLIKADSETQLRQRMRDTLRMINPLNGNGKIRSLSPDGSIRELNCYYTGGLEGDESRNSKGLWWQKVILIFEADDPFWYDSSTIVQTFKLNESPGTFFPILPLRLVSSTVFADITINNTGDVETYPEWIIQGPGEGIKITNLTTGDVIYFDHPNAVLQAGETLSINTSPYPPNEKTITKSDGSNLFYWLSDDSSLWSIQEGNNAIQIQMANATSDSSIQLTYRNRFWGP